MDWAEMTTKAINYCGYGYAYNDYTVGNWWWKIAGEDGPLCMRLIVPSPRPAGFVPVRLFMRPGYLNGRMDWSVPGDLEGHWDGNIERPTLKPSILVPDHWHGYVRNGVLVTA